MYKYHMEQFIINTHECLQARGKNPNNSFEMVNNDCNYSTLYYLLSYFDCKHYRLC